MPALEQELLPMKPSTIINITCERFFKRLKSLQPDKLPVDDGLAKALSYPLPSIYHKCVEKSELWNQWRDVDILHIYKKGKYFTYI